MVTTRQSTTASVGLAFIPSGQKARFRDEDLTDHWVTEAKRWITEHQGKPFFLLFCSHAIHVPRVVHERYQGVSGHGPRGDAIVELDDSVGAIRQTLKSLDLDRKTLIVFCSDNGPVLDDGYQDDAIERLGSAIRMVHSGVASTTSMRRDSDPLARMLARYHIPAGLRSGSLLRRLRGDVHRS